MIDAELSDPAWGIVGAADANQDGYPDLYWHNRSTGQVSIWTMQGRVQVRGRAIEPDGFADTTWQVRGVGDLNGDRVPDLLWQRTVPRAPGEYEVAAWLMTGVEGLQRLDAAYLTPPTVPEAGWTMVGPK